MPKVSNKNKKEVEELLKDPVLDQPSPPDALIDIENKKEDKPVVEEPTVEVEESKPPVEEETEPLEVESEEEQPETPKQDEQPREPDVDYKEKYSESSREATALYFKNQKLTGIIEEVTNISEPTEEELRAYAKTKGAEYDELDDFSRNILKDTYVNSKGLDRIRKVAEETKQAEVWAKKVDDFVNDAETIKSYPSLPDYEEEFKKYCSKESRRGMDLTDLVASFLFRQDKVPQIKHKGSILLSGGNGRNTPPKPAKMTEVEVMSLRLKNPKAYRRAIKEGKIDTDI